MSVSSSLLLMCSPLPRRCSIQLVVLLARFPCALVLVYMFGFGELSDSLVALCLSLWCSLWQTDRADRVARGGTACLFKFVGNTWWLRWRATRWPRFVDVPCRAVSSRASPRRVYIVTSPCILCSYDKCELSMSSVWPKMTTMCMLGGDSVRYALSVFLALEQDRPVQIQVTCSSDAPTVDSRLSHRDVAREQ